MNDGADCQPTFHNQTKKRLKKMDKDNLMLYGKGILFAIGAVVLFYIASNVAAKAISNMPKVKELADKV